MSGAYDFQRCGEGWKWSPQRGNWHVVEYFRANGLNVMPLIANGRRCKVPKMKWSAFQTVFIPEDELRRYFHDPFSDPSGIGVICGVTSGNLELLDFDGDLLWDWSDRVESEIGPGFREEHPIVMTPSGGYHLYYRCPIIQGNQKLAFNEEGLIEIETRGQRGMAVLPGSPPSTHPCGKSYRLVFGSFEHIPIITPDRREVFLEMGKSFDEQPAKRVNDESIHDLYPEGFRSSGFADRPGDDFNARATWDEILEPKGWTLRQVSGGVCYWRRPGKYDSSSSATTGHCKTESGLDLLHVFSTNAAPFESEQSYTKFHAYTLLFHNGNFHDAAESLAAQGYGSRASLSRDEEEIASFYKEYYSE
jgi:putative DNA primase/helicase